jgi:hypothetical protein
MKQRFHNTMAIMFSVAALLPLLGRAQVNTGSTGSDGALDFSAITNSTNIVIDMHDHPTGIYQYTYVNIPQNVAVSFIPNANNTPVYWLVQSNVVVNGSVNVSGQNIGGMQTSGGIGGPGGYRGGDASNGNSPATVGQGPGGGGAGGQSGSYNYGNTFLIPLLGGSGGGGGSGTAYGSGGGGGGGGGGGAILIAASGSITITGSISASGGLPGNNAGWGSGGAIRLVASQINGYGSISAGPYIGRIRFDTYDNEFTGGVSGQFSSGFQPIIIPTAGQIPQLTVASVGGVPVSASPTGVLSTPDAVISAQQSNPMPVVVNCTNLPLGTAITVTIVPMTGSPVSAVGSNNTGTLASSTATISITIPRGGGLIYATASTGN